MTKTEKLRAARERMAALMQIAENEKRDFSDSENEEMKSLSTQINTLTEEIAREEKEAAVRAERQRVSDITKMCRHFGLDEAEYIEKGVSSEDVKAAVLEKLMTEKAPLGVGIEKDEGDKFRDAAAESLLIRANEISRENAKAGGAEFAKMTLSDLAAEALEKDGDKSNFRKMSPSEVFDAAYRQYFNPTAAFPAILDTAVKKAYEQGYNKAAVTFDRFTSKGSLPDFKSTQSNYLAGAAGEFLYVPEGGELKHDIPSDHTLPTRKIKTYGRQFTMTREAFINDDIGYLTTIPSRYAAAARKTINKQVFNILYNNPAIYDGVTYFHATTHKNLIGTGAAPSSSAIRAMIKLLRLQTDQDGDNIMLTPENIVVPVGYGFTLAEIFNSATINGSGNTQAANPLYNAPLTVIEDAELNGLAGASACPWFMFANRNEAKNIQVDYLDGNEIPTIRRSQPAGQLGFVWDIYLDWGVTVLDYRGSVKNPGVSLS